MGLTEAHVGIGAAASVVLPVHNAERTLGSQLSALASQIEAPEFEVVVVLNRCSDDSRAVAQSFAPRLPLVLVEADDKASAPHARNVGAATSSAPILLFCDADDRVSPRWIAEMVKALEPGGPDFVGGRIIVDRQGLAPWLYRVMYQWLDGSCIFGFDLPFAVSASFGCRREAFEKVGGMDERFSPAGCDDVDLSARLLRAGCRIGEAPNAPVSYRPRTTVREALKQSRRNALGGATLAAKEGELRPAPTRRAMLRQTAGGIKHYVGRTRTWDPRELAYHMVREVYGLREQRRLAARETRVRIPSPMLEEFTAPPSTALIGGLALQARPLQARWYGTSGIERSTLALVDTLLPEGGVFVDCGANVGVFTLAAALRVGAGGQVIAFEPDPRTRQLLGENLRRHHLADRVDVRSEAVGARDIRLEFTQYDNDPVSGFFTAPEVFMPGEVVARAPVAVVPLDGVVDGPVSMVKIDVEGFEPEVLAGASGLLARSPDAVVIVELNPAALHNAGATADNIFGYFPSERWALWLIDEHAAPHDRIRSFDASARGFIDDVSPNWYGNILAIPPDRQDDVRALVERMRLHGHTGWSAAGR